MATAPRRSITTSRTRPATSTTSGSASAGRVTLARGGASFSIVAGEEVTEQVHLAFPARSNDTVDAFHRAALDAGHRDNGAPGERAAYHRGYYGAFVLDPDGNNVEVVNHNRPTT